MYTFRVNEACGWKKHEVSGRVLFLVLHPRIIRYVDVDSSIVYASLAHTTFDQTRRSGLLVEYSLKVQAQYSSEVQGGVVM